MFPDAYESQYFSFFDLPNNQRAYTLTGVARFTLQGGGGGRWKRGSLDMALPIPGLPSGQGLKLVHWAPFMTLNSISNDGVSNDAGWAVDSWTMDVGSLATTELTLAAALAVGDSDGYILRVGYTIDLVGTLGPAGH